METPSDKKIRCLTAQRDELIAVVASRDEQIDLLNCYIAAQKTIRTAYRSGSNRGVENALDELDRVERRLTRSVL